jgi:hypothetical protein
MELIHFVDIDQFKPKDEEEGNDFLVKILSPSRYEYEVAEWLHDWDSEEGGKSNEKSHFNISPKIYPRKVVAWSRIYEDPYDLKIR